MALIYADRAKETSTTTGTGTYTLAGAVTGFEAFSTAVGNGNTCYYCATDNTDWEVGLGTYTSAGTTLARTTILASSNSDAAVNWGAGTREIFVTVPAAIESSRPTVSATVDVSGGASSYDITGIPSGVKFIILNLVGVSLSGTDDLLVQLGDAGGTENTGYISATATATGNNSSTSGFVVRAGAAANVLYGHVFLALVDAASFQWESSHAMRIATTACPCGGGDKSLSAELTKITLDTTGTNTFDAGKVNILYFR